MKRFIVAITCGSLILFPCFGFVYTKGCRDGVIYYQHSKRFMLTLYSMYMFGVHDGYAACKAGK